MGAASRGAGEDVDSSDPDPQERGGPSRAAIVGWALWTVAMVLRVVAIGFALRRTAEALPIAYGLGLPTLLAACVFGTAFSTVGTIVATRRPANPIGWLFCVVGLVQGTIAACVFSASVLLVGSSDQVVLFLGWLAGPLLQAAIIGLPALCILVFPAGTLVSHRWRPVVLLVVVAMIFRFVVVGFISGTLFMLPTVDNPYARSGPVADVLANDPGLGLLAGSAAFVLAGSSIVVRFRRAESEERRQLLWFTWAAVVSAAASLPFVAVTVSAGVATGRGSDLVGLFFLALTLLPISAGIAILRYRLYEIDRIVNRTVVYGGLTAILAGIFTAGIALGQRAFIALTGERSDVAVVLVTLFVATAYAPMRKRLEAVVDRRFKYDQRRFGPYGAELAQLRSLLDPEQAAGRLLREAMSELGAVGGAVELDRGTEREGLLRTAGDWTAGTAVVSVPIGREDRPIGRLMLAGRSNGSAYSQREIEALRAAAEMLGQTLVGVGAVSAPPEPEA